LHETNFRLQFAYTTKQGYADMHCMLYKFKASIYTIEMAAEKENKKTWAVFGRVKQMRIKH